MALGKARTVSEPHSPSQTYDSIYERAVKEQMWRSGLRSPLGVISHDPSPVPFGGYREHLRFTEEETEALRGGLESPAHTKSSSMKTVWVPGQNPDPSPVYSPLPTPSCVQMGVSLSRLDGRLCGSCVCLLSFPLQGQVHRAGALLCSPPYLSNYNWAWHRAGAT